MQATSQWTQDFEKQIDRLRAKLKERRDLWPELAKSTGYSPFMMKGLAHNWKQVSKIGTEQLKMIADALTDMLEQERDNAL